ncbi:sugar transferase [Bacillus sp. FJAT-49705]|uniref:Sugar transferase n=1 Tax=Cytobacillus citreus TaxID=2833586 RepID=A0ABS5NXP0_9BACI|nr:sugar transferase [Cytobacillus citreus]MBS4192612.1 sugar transferase [Cytobacillus citreus]
MIVIKRFIDIFFASITLIVFLIPIVLIGLAVLIFLGRPIFFIQERAGQFGKPFKIIKFRSMKNTKDRDGNLLPNELRQSSFGNFIRKYSLDELPQLINILKGDISIVGPRPLLLDYVPLYNQEQKKRLNAKPGLTGWAQINGRNAISWKEKFEYDVWYVENWSLLLDIKIIALTAYKVIKSEGVNTASNSMVTRFKGDEES